ncbi:succinate dehydrogenase, hydrophobic membrane anchor protein [Celerinatantimonas sp. MCCC 1A17872]|uniref:succinate dehydrogenase, hydrophobic membrane anchor protein n=1 Tax=Celerinatantimonas sp. MCCC 1A17872 TaxID=3177514 RepID=UPI0038C2350E
MVNNAATLGRSGTHSYLLVRASAIVLGLYFIYLVSFIACHDLSYQIWQGFFSQVSTKAFTLLALVSMLVHAWIGLWQVLSDYVHHTYWRMFLQGVLNLVALFYVAAGVVILWSV